MIFWACSDNLAQPGLNLPEGVLQSDWAQVKCTYFHLASDWLLQTGKAFNVNNISATKERNSQNTARQRNSNEFLCEFETIFTRCLAQTILQYISVFLSRLAKALESRWRIIHQLQSNRARTGNASSQFLTAMVVTKQPFLRGKISGKPFRNKRISIPAILTKLAKPSNGRLSKYIQLCGRREVNIWKFMKSRIWKFMYIVPDAALFLYSWDSLKDLLHVNRLKNVRMWGLCY